jgi:HAD superfamily hydrolase (TIGR01509 family)
MTPSAQLRAARAAAAPARAAAAAAASARRLAAPAPPARRALAAGSVPAAAARRALSSAAAAAPAAAALRNFDWPEALLFDCDGVLVDTEAEGHRPAFNAAFARRGVPHAWGLEQYGELLEVGGGKERMDAFFSARPAEEPWASVVDPAARKAFLKDLHELKTDIFNELIDAGSLPLRPGVARLVAEARAAGVKVAVCSTSNERAVSNIVRLLLGAEVAAEMRVFAGDVVARKKPAPDIYLLAARELGVDPARCVVVEDSRIGVAAGAAAGMRVVVTESYYTRGEDFAAADAVFDCIGEAGEERFSLHDLTTPGALAARAAARAGAA